MLVSREDRGKRQRERKYEVQEAGKAMTSKQVVRTQEPKPEVELI